MEFLLKINSIHKELLGSIRHWENLKVAFDDQWIWVKDFTILQSESSELQQIPYAVLYEVRDNLLFLRDSLLPKQKMPSALLWSTILRALPIELPKLNLNYFGISEQLVLGILPSEKEHQAWVLVSSYEDAKNYIETAPDVRLKSLSWVVSDEKIILFGTPLLPIKGETYWRINDFLLPTGFDLEFEILANTIQEKINENQENWIFWQQDGSYFKVPKENVKPLSISSFRLTFSE